ncbi:MAG: LysM peptidoglycan-binding domain-containing protein [Anaerolineae bacterium]|nr:LysM peptidoglycan-binding domain-containing protein [Anaerolineae bacterium]
MMRKPILLTLLVLLVVSMMLGGCKKAAVPDLPTLPEEDMMSAEAADNTTPQAEPTQTGENIQPTLEPTAVPVEPTPEPTAVPVEPTPKPTATPEATAIPETTTVAAVTTGPTTYVVKAGDNLFRIAVNHGTTVEAVARANNITNPTLIYVGQKLTIPGTDTTSVAPTPPPSSTGEKVHIVQPGENLFRVALKYNYDYFYLAKYNNISNPALVYVGQKIRIP